MGLLNFDKPKKVRKTDEHNAIHSSDSGVAGTYVPNMSDEDRNKFRAKHIKGQHERIEIRVGTPGADIVVKVYKKAYLPENNHDWSNRHDEIQFSSNGKIDIPFKKWVEINQAIGEALNKFAEDDKGQNVL